MSGLVVQNLSVFLRKDGREIVKSLSFQTGPGESLILLGQSGCGKTMTCRAVMGLLDRRVFRTEGIITWDGIRLSGLSERQRSEIYGKRIAFIPQNPMTALDPSVRIGKQMEEMLRLHMPFSSAERSEAIRQALLDAGLDSDERICRSYPYMLSGGMLQRVLIAMALSTDAGLVIADEPTTALDMVHRNAIVDSFVKLKEKGKAVLFVTHDFAAARRLGGNMLVMKDGAAEETGTTREIGGKPKTEYIKTLIKASALSKGDRYADC